jgi:hypothetical protein
MKANNTNIVKLSTISIISIDGLANLPFSHNLNQNTFLSSHKTPRRAPFVGLSLLVGLSRPGILLVGLNALLVKFRGLETPPRRLNPRSLLVI